jgi:hypothetical protein
VEAGAVVGDQQADPYRRLGGDRVGSGRAGGLAEESQPRAPDRTVETLKQERAMGGAETPL